MVIGMRRSARWYVVAALVVVACGSRALPPRDGGGGAGSGGGSPEGGAGSRDSGADVASGDTGDDIGSRDIGVEPGDGGICPPIADADVQPECANGLDDDGDGLVDAMDPDCTTPYDSSEALFEGKAYDVETCRRDCQFDGNSGQGDDQCDGALGCDPMAPMPACGTAPPTACSVSAHCRDFCLPLTPNGCDCFGCCAVDVAGERRTVLISEGIGCSSDALADPTRCPSCTQNTDCLNKCLPNEICFAGAAPITGPLIELVPRCRQSQIACGPGAMPPCLCPAGTYCVTGCCVAFPARVP